MGSRRTSPSVYRSLWPNVADGLRYCAEEIYRRIRNNGAGTFDVWRTRGGALVVRSPSRPPDDVYNRDRVGRYSASLNARPGAVTPDMIYDDLLEHEGIDHG